MNKNNMQRKIIMHHYQHPTQLVKSKPNGFQEIHAIIDSCSDDFIIYIKLDNNIIKDILFTGVGCAISTSSLNLLATYLINKTKEDAIAFVDNYHMFIMGEKVNEEILGELIVFRNIKRHLNRIKCGLIGPNHIKILLEAQND